MRNPVRYFCLAVIFFYIVYIPFQPVFAVTEESPVLREAMSGKNVEQLQKDLKQLGFFHQEATGYYGAVTKAAVIEFQKTHGLDADGIAGESTQEKINGLLNEAVSATVFKKGMNSTGIRELQRDLKLLGFFSPAPTGYYGDATESAITAFQKKHGIAADGIAGAVTQSKINSLVKQVDKVKIVVDPGHGGIDVGASKGNVVESEVNLSISKKLKEYLEDYGYEVALTRNKDVALDSLSKRGNTRQERDLDARSNIINDSGAEFFVSVHVNSLPESPSTNGSIVYYYSRSAKSKELAKSIQKALNEVTASNYKRQSQSSKTANFYVLRNTDIPGVLVETAFVTNKRERELLATDSFRENLAKAILKGIEDYVK